MGIIIGESLLQNYLAFLFFLIAVIGFILAKGNCLTSPSGNSEQEWFLYVFQCYIRQVTPTSPPGAIPRENNSNPGSPNCILQIDRIVRLVYGYAHV